MKDGRPHMVFGTPGGDQQDQWSLQFFLNVVDFGMDLQAAIDAASFHTTHFPSSFYPHGANPKRVIVEGRLPAATREALTRLGHDIQVTDDWTNGQVCAVRFDPDSGLIRWPRRGASAAAIAAERTALFGISRLKRSNTMSVSVR